MAETTTVRFALKRWSADSDSPTREDFDGAHAQVELLAAGFISGTAGARPAADATNERFLHYATDSGQLSYSTGSSWLDLPDTADVTSIANTAVSDHEALPDPHSQYVLGDGVNTLTVSATQPSSPAVGDLWVDTST